MRNQPQPPAEQSPAGQQRPAVRIRRGLLVGYGVLFALIVGSFIEAVLGLIWTQTFNSTPIALALFASLPLWLVIMICVALLAALIALIWLWRVYLQVKHADEEKKAKEQLEEQRGMVADVVMEHAEEPLKQIETKLTETQQVLEKLNLLLKGTDRALSPGVIAPTGMPRAASLVGRDDVLTDLMSKLRAGTTMGIFALRGMGGVGKTALAAEAVVRLANEQDVFPGGAAWIPCENLTGTEGLTELWGRVARMLGLAQVAAQPDPQIRRAALAQALVQSKRLLLALDNIEPDLDAEAVLDTLAIKGHTALLLTARHVAAPHRLTPIEITPLDPPPATELFKQQLQKHNLARPTAEDGTVLPKLLEMVGGLPLAIELTAAYAGLQRLPLADVLREVEADGLHAPALKGDPQRALATRFDRSWVKLTTSQQRLFAALSLLAGASFPREAALTLANATEDMSEPLEDRAGSAGDVATLVDYALVEPLEGGRLRLHLLLREYATQQLAKLSSALWEHLGDTMAVYWLAYAQDHSGYGGMDALEAETAGLMGALTWAHEHARHHGVLALAHALNRFWFVRGRIEEAHLARLWALEAAKSLKNRDEERWAIHELAVLDSSTGQLERARKSYEQALELAQQSGDLVGEQVEVQCLAAVDEQMGRWAAAREGYKRALELAHQLKDLRAEQVAVHSLAVMESKTRHAEEALAGFQKALELAQQLGDLLVEGTELMNFGAFISQLGETTRGRQLIQQGLEIYHSLKYIQGIGECNQYLAQIDILERNRDAAIAHYREALRCYEQVQALDAEEVRADLRRLEAGEEIGPSAKPEEVRALRAFLNTDSWEERRAMLEREQVLLLSDTSSQFLTEVVDQARLAHREDEASYLEMHQKLLASAREVGIDAAWAEFEMARHADGKQTENK